MRVVLQPNASCSGAAGHLQRAGRAEGRDDLSPRESVSPAVERHAALAALAAASGVIAWPEVLMLTLGAGLSSLAFLRTCCAAK
jgi:hypothetical protein